MTSDRSRSRSVVAFLVATGIATVGSAFGLLGATATAAAAGRGMSSGVLTGVYMATVLLSTGIATPYAARIAARSGPRRTFGAVASLNALVWVATGLALLAGAPPFATIMCTAVVIGATSGVVVVLRPIVTKAYLGTDRTSGAVARVAVVTGPAWGIGGLVAGRLLSHISLGWGLVVDGVLAAPLVVILLRHVPATEPQAPERRLRPWHETRVALRRNPTLQLSAAVTAAAMLFLAPATSLVVPIAQGLRQSPLVSGAGLLMAAFSAGELCSPLVVRRLNAQRHDLPASVLATAWAGGTLVALAAGSAVLGHRVELVAWVVIGVPFGAMAFAAKALYVGAAAESGTERETTHNLAAATLVGLGVAPLGTMMYGILISALSADLAVLIGGIAAVLAAVTLHGSAQRAVADSAQGSE